MSADPAKIYRRAQFWEKDTCTLLDIANVLGRWESTSEWQVRTKFSAPAARRVESIAQAATQERYEYAQRNELAERVAMQQNVPKLKFKNGKIAAAFSKSVSEFNAMPVTETAIDVVFDALVQSKSSLVKSELADQRVASWKARDGSINEGTMQVGLYKSRALVMFSWLFFGKGRVVGVLVAGRIALDNLNLDADIIPYVDWLYWALALFAAFNGVNSQSSVIEATKGYDTFSEKDSADAGESVAAEAKYSTIFEKFAAQGSGTAPAGGRGIDKSEYGTFGVLAIILFFFYFLPSFAKSQGWTG